MKKIILSLIVFSILLAGIIAGCKRTTTTPTEPTPVPATPTPTPAVWNATKLIDDMERIASSGDPGPDNANAIPASEGGPGYWYTYDDVKAVLIPPDGDGNTSNASYVWPMSATRWTIVLGNPTPEPTFIMSSPGYGGSGYAARMTGYVTAAFKYGFAGMGVNFLGVNPDNSKKPVDISGMTGVRFHAKGDGKSYRIKLPSQSPLFVRGDSDNHYGRQFTAPSNWTQINILLTAFTQEAGWGTTVAWSDAMKYIDSIQFQTVSQPIESFDLWVDNLEVYK